MIPTLIFPVFICRDRSQVIRLLVWRSEVVVSVIRKMLLLRFQTVWCVGRRAWLWKRSRWWAAGESAACAIYVSNFISFSDAKPRSWYHHHRNRQKEFFLFPTDTRLWSFQTETHHRCRHHTDDVCGVRSGGRVSSAGVQVECCRVSTYAGWENPKAYCTF